MTRYEYEFLSKGKRGGSGVQAKNNKYYKYWNELEDKLRVYAWFESTCSPCIYVAPCIYRTTES